MTNQALPLLFGARRRLCCTGLSRPRPLEHFLAGFMPPLRVLISPALIIGVGFIAMGNAPVLAGDGSGTNNPDLLRGSYNAPCTDPRLCPTAPRSMQAPATTGSINSGQGARPANCEILARLQISAPECGRAPAPVAAQTMPSRQPVYQRSGVPVQLPSPQSMPSRQQQPQRTAAPVPTPVRQPVAVHTAQPRGTYDDQSLRGDWSVTLRGSVVNDSSGWRFESSLVPEGSLTVQGRRGSTALRGSANLVQDGFGQFRIGSASVGISTNHAAAQDVSVTGTVDLNVEQDRAGSATLGTNVTRAPMVFTGSASAGVMRNFGPLQAGLTLSGLRGMVGASGLSGGIEQNNDDRNRTGFGLAGRLQYALTPIVSGFTDLSVNREFYDMASASLGVKQDSWTYAGRVGLSARWTNGIEAEASIGYGLRRFDAASLGQAGGLIYGGRLGYISDGGIDVAAALESSVSPSGDVSGASVRFDHNLRLEARQVINRWLTARASGGVNWADFAGISALETGYSAGAGLDVLINDHFSVAGDYSYAHTNAVSGSSDTSHRISVGIRASR